MKRIALPATVNTSSFIITNGARNPSRHPIVYLFPTAYVVAYIQQKRPSIPNTGVLSQFVDS